MTPLGRYVLETLVTLAAVAVLAVLVLYAARRIGVGRPSGPLSIAGRLVLDARRAIYLVRIGDVVYVVGASEAGLSKLGEIAANTLGAADEPPKAGGLSALGFQEILKQVGRRGSGAGEQGGTREGP
jgi:flagellar protein FliO/FliZ